MSEKAIVTGASKGIGKAIAEALVREGYEVVGTSRDPSKMKDSERIEGVKYLPLDLSDEKSVDRFIRDAGEADVLINNAGQSQSGAVEEVPIDRIRHLFDLNVINQIKLTQGFLPAMRRKGRGAIINVTSMAAKNPVPFSTFYGSTKAAMEAFSRGLRSEVKGFGIKVVVVSPFSIKTDIPQEQCWDEKSPYYDKVVCIKGIRDHGIASAPGPEIVAELVLKVLRMKDPKPDYAVGKNAWLLSHLMRYLPKRMVEKNVRKQYKMD